MKHFSSALAILVAVSVSEARPAVQDTPGEDTREVRIFVLDRTRPERSRKDAAAVLTLTRKSGPGLTILMPLAVNEAPAPPEGAAPGLIRRLISTPYFIEMDLGDGVPAPRRREPAAAAPAPEDAPKKADGETAPLPAQDVLRGARKGTWFSRRLPASAFSQPFTATVMIRFGTVSYTSEEFQGPRSDHDTPEAAASSVDRSLESLQKRAAEFAGFMDLKPTADLLIRDLSRLAPAGFEDASGEIEVRRQWCLARARAIQDSCYTGNTGRIQVLGQQCGPQMKEIHELLQQRHKGEPVPTPATPETPPTVK
jgi:hypothetical protein